MADATELAGPGSAGAELFGEVLPLAQKYAQLLTTVGVERGVVGPAEAERIWDRHLLNCAVVARLIPSRASLVDLGSGAGLPGIGLAMLLPGAKVALVEALARRVDFLVECLPQLRPLNFQVVRALAEHPSDALSPNAACPRAV